MSVELLIIDGPQIGRRFPVGNVPMTFGRSPAAQLSFPQDNFISGNHLTVQSDGRTVMLTDLRSTNGTFLNGQRIGQAIANIGDTIKIGSMTLQVVFTQDPAPVPQQYVPPMPVIAQATTVIPTFAHQPPPPLPRVDLPLPPAIEIPAPPPPAAVAPPPPYVPYPPFDPQPPPAYPGSAPPFPGPTPPFDLQPTPPAAPPSFPPFAGASGAPAPPPPDSLGAFQVGSSAFADIEPSPFPPFPEPPAPAPPVPAPPAPEPLPLIALRAIGKVPGPIFGLLNPLADPAVGELLRDANADLAGYCLASSADPFAPVPPWAPYLLPLAADGEVLRQVVEKGWGSGWAAFLTSTASYEELRTHFKKFVTVQMQSGAEPYFRFWEPPVLRNFFGAANPAELTMFCGPVREWVLEADSSSSLLRAHNTPAGLSKTVEPLL